MPGPIVAIPPTGTWRLVLLEDHAACLEVGHLGLDVVDREGHLGVAARRGTEPREIAKTLPASSRTARHWAEPPSA